MSLNSTSDNQSCEREIYIGLMSGTSIDSLEAAMLFVSTKDHEICDLSIGKVVSYEWLSDEKELLHGLCDPHSRFNNVQSQAQGAQLISQRSAQLVNDLLKITGYSASDIVAIGSHGQTIFHQPEKSISVQIDNGPNLAALTGIDAIVNFRAADLAAGGQGAPLAQIFHSALFGKNNRPVFMLNLGGIANITALDAKGNIIAAFDTGPANTLIDLICREAFNEPYDKDGNYARSGKVNEPLLNAMLTHEYFATPYPKSTGRELFNAEFLKRFDALPDFNNSSREDILNLLATLTELTACTVLDGIKQVVTNINSTAKSKACSDAPSYTLDTCELIVAGGGADNGYMMERFKVLAEAMGLKLSISSIKQQGIAPQALEPAAFAYFAALCTHGIQVNLNSSTGAKAPSILGCICPSINGHFVRSLRAN